MNGLYTFSTTYICFFVVFMIYHYMYDSKMRVLKLPKSFKNKMLMIGKLSLYITSSIIFLSAIPTSLLEQIIILFFNVALRLLKYIYFIILFNLIYNILSIMKK
ncbi:MAG: hypothetical protein ACOC2W_01085 [bacterium]